MKPITAKVHKNLHKLSIYTGHATKHLIPSFWLRQQRNKLLRKMDSMPSEEVQAIWQRVHYYNRLSGSIDLPKDTNCLETFQREKSWSYYLDLVTLLRYYPPKLHFCHQFGDVRDVPSTPTLVKSRPIGNHNENSVLLKLNQVRHYYIPKDKLKFEKKLPLAVWRGACHQEHRRQFVQEFHDNPLCDVADIHHNATGNPWHGQFLSIPEQLRYRYIISLEGKDVATNLKWIMASNSVCLMRQPRFETWFMEGQLRPNYHYVQLEDDYSDLEEKIAYYEENPEAAKKIVHHANCYIKKFQNSETELLVGLLVLQKYFSKTGQI